MTVAGLLLAAGGGRRFGGPKALAVLDGELLVERGERLLAQGGCDPVVVVLGAAAEEVLAAVALSGAVVASDWEDGLSASLRAGLGALESGAATGCVIALVDQPGIGAEAVARLLAAHDAGAVAAVATYEGVARNPVLLGRGVWSEVAAAAAGDAGARHWLRAHPELVTAVPCDGTGLPIDVDTREDLAGLTSDSPT